LRCCGPYFGDLVPAYGEKCGLEQAYLMTMTAAAPKLARSSDDSGAVATHWADFRAQMPAIRQWAYIHYVAVPPFF